VDPLRPLGAEVRETLRIPVSFQSFIYPLSGAWKGRRTVQAVDLSCGGISFRCAEELSQGESLEVVIPLTRSPLVLTCQVLRSSPSPEGDTVYALKFSDLCKDADQLIQEFVFSEQIRTHAS
jgi:c-di-GMP-binding flagellar brake protein YcgR